MITKDPNTSFSRTGLGQQYHPFHIFRCCRLGTILQCQKHFVISFLSIPSNSAFLLTGRKGLDNVHFYDIAIIFLSFGDPALSQAEPSST